MVSSISILSIVLVCSQLAVSMPFPPFPPPVFDNKPSTPSPESSTPPTEAVTEAVTGAPSTSVTKFPLPPSSEPPTKKSKDIIDSFQLSMFRDIVLPPNSQTQLQNLRLDNRDTGFFEPGHYLGVVQDLDPFNGVFTVINEGLFLVSASVQLIKDPASTADSSSTQEVSVAVCIDATSDTCNEALYTTGQLRGTQTTLAVFGNVQFNKNARVSIRVSNQSGSGVIVLQRSSFSVHKL